MKTNILYLSFFYILSAVSLCGCSNEDEPIVATTDGTLLTVIACAEGFASTDSTAQTRASESDYTTTFVKGDQIGVFAVKNGSIITGCKNVPCTYDGTTWSGTVYECTGATYFAYYPYDENLETSGITSASDIVAAFNTTVSTATDQSTYTKYTACDLMTATAASPTSGKTLTFTFTHQMSLIEISLPEQKCKSTDDANAYEYFTPALGATFSLTQSNSGSTMSIQPCPMGNGIYRYIVPAGTSGVTVSGEFNTADSKTIEYTKSSLSLSVGNYKRLKVTYNGSNNAVVRALAVGDYYYSDGSICPGDASYPPSEDCLGIVYWLGDIKSDNYGLLDTRFPNGTHGLVISLWEMPDPDNAGGEPKMTWTYGGYEYVNNWLGSATWSGTVSRPGSFSSIQVTDKMQGYANTVALEEYNKYVENTGSGKNQNLRVKPIKGLAAFQTAHPAPVSSSGWYWPSVCELKQVCWGQGVTSQSTSGKSMLNPQIGKVGGTTFGLDYYWSSTERSNYSLAAWYVDFYNGGVNNFGRKNDYTYRVRPLLAF